MKIKELIHKLSKYNPDIDVTSSENKSLTHIMYMETTNSITLYFISKVKD